MPKTFIYEKNRKVVQGYFSPELHEKLLKRAKQNRRSVSAELTCITEKALAQDEQRQSEQHQHWSPELSLK
ncbi:MAG: hypothetical protein AUG51_16160 [Acidobacteria bacterium 13_1_20CM_3_53_8]|nr:MAG: hypothetical protein AUG51_16160 [Acidobacteria bacterium 13_1_20CM_3_53_8]